MPICMDSVCLLTLNPRRDDNSEISAILEHFDKQIPEQKHRNTCTHMLCGDLHLSVLMAI